MTDRHYVGNIGTEILVNCGSEITGATNLKLKVKKPDGTEVEWTAAIDGTDHLKYTTLAADFSVAGTYFLQASLTLGGWSGLGKTAQFEIHDPYTG
jgi:hypothetical protein